MYSSRCIFHLIRSMIKANQYTFVHVTQPITQNSLVHGLRYWMKKTIRVIGEEKIDTNWNHCEDKLERYKKWNSITASELKPTSTHRNVTAEMMKIKEKPSFLYALRTPQVPVISIDELRRRYFGRIKISPLQFEILIEQKGIWRTCDES